MKPELESKTTMLRGKCTKGLLSFLPRGPMPWSRIPIRERVQVFFRYKNLLENNREKLAKRCREESLRSSSHWMGPCCHA